MTVCGGRSIPGVVDELDLHLMRQGWIEIAGDLDGLRLTQRMVRGDVVGTADLLSVDVNLDLRVAVEHVARYLQRQRVAPASTGAGVGTTAADASTAGSGTTAAAAPSRWICGYIKGKRAVDVHHGFIAIALDCAIARRIGRLGAVDGRAVQRNGADINVDVVTVGARGTVPLVVDESHLYLVRDGRIKIVGDLDGLRLTQRMMRADVVGRVADLLAVDEHLDLRVAAAQHVARHLQAQRIAAAGASARASSSASARTGTGAAAGRRWRRISRHVEGERAVDVHHRLIAVDAVYRAIVRRVARSLRAGQGRTVQRDRADIDIDVMPVGRRGAVPIVVEQLHLHLMRHRRIEIAGDLDGLRLALRVMRGDGVGRVADLLAIDEHLDLR